MPADVSGFHPGAEHHSAAMNSGLRNNYWHTSILVTDDNVINSLQLSVYQHEASMFQRPIPACSDYFDVLEATLYIIDHYNDDEWRDVMAWLTIR